MLEDKLITTIYKDRAGFETIRGLISSPADIFTDVNSMLFDRAVDFYEMDTSAKCVDLDVVSSYVSRTYPRQEKTFSLAIDKIRETDAVSSNNILHEFIEARKGVLGHRLASALINNQPAEELIEEYTKLSTVLTSYDTHHHTELSTLRGLEILDKSKEASPDNLIPILPEELSERIGGGVLPGHHILVFARPETGKSLFVINMVRGFAAAGKKVLYIGNEDPESAISSRLVSSITGQTEEERQGITEDGIRKLLKDGGIENITLAHLSPGTFTEISCLIEEHEPDILIVDQIRNVAAGSDGLTVGQERAGIEMRNLAGKYGIVTVSVAQAGDCASDKLVLSMNDVDSSKTGLPATVDLMVGIGINPEYESKSKRMISICRNKMNGSHEYFTISVDRHTSRVW